MTRPLNIVLRYFKAINIFSISNKLRSPHELDLSSKYLQLFCGLPATLAGPMIRPSAAGHQRTLAQGGRSSLVAPQLSTPAPIWTTQVSTLTKSYRSFFLMWVMCFSLSVIRVYSFNRWIREFHLHISYWSPRDWSGSACESYRRLSGFWPMCVFLVPHVWVTHWHTAYKTAQTNREWTRWHPPVDGQWPPRQSLERRSCPRATYQQTLSGKSHLNFSQRNVE